MSNPGFEVEGGASALAAALSLLPPPSIRVLVNAAPVPDCAGIMARCAQFAASQPTGQEALIVTILPGAGDHMTNAALRAFTKQYALQWAPQRVRVNAILAGPVPQHDLAAAVCAMASWPSMTGQTIQLGVL